uniref:Uncharacterized protein n=1 Tax=Lepeophtheirus salmonis TaxID=72036 RepID=A0A0K2UMH9_LEPSM
MLVFMSLETVLIIFFWSLAPRQALNSIFSTLPVQPEVCILDIERVFYMLSEVTVEI